MAQLIDTRAALRKAYAAALESNDAKIKESRVMYVDPFCIAVWARLTPAEKAVIDQGQVTRFVYRQLFY